MGGGRLLLAALQVGALDMWVHLTPSRGGCEPQHCGRRAGSQFPLTLGPCVPPGAWSAVSSGDIHAEGESCVYGIHLQPPAR